MAYIKKTSKNYRPYITPEGKISSCSFVKGTFKKILGLYKIYVVECLENLEPHLPIDEWYKMNVKYDFPRSVALELYILNKKS